jgi:choline dehydrogenase-like flavoprotein
MYFNSKGKEAMTFDAIVIGTGISGGWAAKELSEKGLKTLVLERGRMMKHPDYPTANLESWELPNNGKTPRKEIEEFYQKQNRTGYTISEASKHLWLKDTDYPYTEEKPFDWIRGYHVGGRSIMWGRQSYRLSEMDFEANAKDGVAVDWPVRYTEIAPWYDYVEKFIGVSGQNEGLSQLPDGKFQKPMEMNCLEKSVREKVKTTFKERLVTIGRVANITEPIGKRGACQSRNKCSLGCPFGAYFSSLSSTLPAAEESGNMTLRPFSIVTEIVYDPQTQKASGVKVVDAESGEAMEFFAKIIFCNASTLGTAQILLNSTSDRFPNGLGNDSGELGHNLMDHHFRLGANGSSDEFSDQYYKGRRPNGIYIPRFRNISRETKKDYLRGFGFQGGASRENWWRFVPELDFGAGFKDTIHNPGAWRMGMTAFGECLPYHENHVRLNKEVLDKHGLPTLTLSAEWKENEMAMRKDMIESAVEILTAGGLRDVSSFDSGCNPGLGIHEMGTARMGKDPKTSVLNKHNQIHTVPNVYVTDGSFMTSAGCQNPSLTYMAFTARAVDHAVSELKKQNL